VTVAKVGKLVDAGRYSEAVRELQELPRMARLEALLRCRDYLASFGERVRAEAARCAAAPEDALDTLLALEGAELVEAEAATEAVVREGLLLRWSDAWQPVAPPVQVESPSNLAVVQAESPSNLAVVQVESPSVLAVLELVGAEVAQQGLVDRFVAIGDGAAHARAVAEADALSAAEADALMAAVQAEAMLVGGDAADGVDGEAARVAYHKAKAAKREGKPEPIYLTLRVPQSLADRLDAAAALLPSDAGPPAGWGRSAVHRAVLLVGLDVLERKAKRGDR
jgi:hypothetical protein